MKPFVFEIESYKRHKSKDDVYTVKTRGSLKQS